MPLGAEVAVSAEVSTEVEAASAVEVTTEVEVVLAVAISMAVAVVIFMEAEVFPVHQEGISITVRTADRDQVVGRVEDHIRDQVQGLDRIRGQDRGQGHIRDQGQDQDRIRDLTGLDHIRGLTDHISRDPHLAQCLMHGILMPPVTGDHSGIRRDSL